MILFLIGFRASGKTTLARRLARRLGCPWLDTDKAIESQARQSIPQIFQSAGEAGFRRLEQQVIGQQISQIPAGQTWVIALGGGAVLSPATRSLLKQHGRCVWLQASAARLAERLAADQSTTPRPPLTDMEPDQEVIRLLADRQPVYADCADYTIDTGELTEDQAVEQIARWWREVDK
jgi:shikimate kinase